MGEVVEEEGKMMRVEEWESGLPSVEDLTPLSQALIPQELASAFSICPVEYRTEVEVNQASQHTISSLQHMKGDSATAVVEEEEEEEEEEDHEEEKGRGREAKRPRLVWTPQLHKRFVEVVGHLGIKNAVPKTIMQLMNVEGLTRENVASHLQKYRLYLKRMHPSSSMSDASASAAAATTTTTTSNPSMPLPLHYPVPLPMPMPMPLGYLNHHWFDHHHPINVHHPPSDWSTK